MPTSRPNSPRWGPSWRSKAACGLLLLALAALVAACGAKGERTPELRVTQVYDGDTIVLSDGRKVRYLGIDTPEMGRPDKPPEPLAEAAKAANAALVLDQLVRLELDQEHFDRYGRTLAYVFLPGGIFVNAELVHRGLARVYLIPPNLRYQEHLIYCQHQAMEARRGLWEKPLTADESEYPGNARTFRFHRPDCKSLPGMSRTNRVVFQHPREAYWQGFSPCRNCRP